MPSVRSKAWRKRFRRSCCRPNYSVEPLPTLDMARGCSHSSTDVTGMRRMSALSEWDSFYLIVGGAAGALIGLQFVVMPLIAERPQAGMADAARAFAAPAVVHF